LVTFSAGVGVKLPIGSTRNAVPAFAVEEMVIVLIAGGLLLACRDDFVDPVGIAQLHAKEAVASVRGGDG